MTHAGAQSHTQEPPAEPSTPSGDAFSLLLGEKCGRLAEAAISAPAPAWSPRAALAQAILAMDTARASDIIAKHGVDIEAPLAGERHAIELWGIGCHALQADQGAAAAAMLLFLFDIGADPTRLPLTIRPSTARRLASVSGREALLAIAADPAFFFDWLDCAPMMEAVTALMRHCEATHGMGRADWLQGQKIAYGVDNANFGHRPSPSMARCLHQAFGKSLEPEHWLFLASSTWNVSFDMGLLIATLRDEKPEMSADAREKFMALALARQAPALLAALADLPGGLSQDIHGGNIAHLHTEFRSSHAAERIPLLWAMLALRSPHRPETSVIRSPLFQALASIPEIYARARRNPRYGALASACALDLREARDAAPWLLPHFPGATWVDFLTTKRLPHIFIELCRDAPDMALEIQHSDPDLRETLRSQAARLATYWAPEKQDKLSRSLDQAWADLERSDIAGHAQHASPSQDHTGRL